MERQGELTMIFQNVHAFSDSMNICKFSAFAEGADEYAQQYAAMVGIPSVPKMCSRPGKGFITWKGTTTTLPDTPKAATHFRIVFPANPPTRAVPRVRFVNSTKCLPSITKTWLGQRGRARVQTQGTRNHLIPLCLQETDTPRCPSLDLFYLSF
ncbi:MAG: hypothetical protein CM15mP45_12360 [Deltaproteobacteria bacterium]|nr:MAG: hypothetical protein CM15mP45_12360 [Deltaproteobacteria bacterium]